MPDLRQLWNSLWLDSFPALFFLLLRAWTVFLAASNDLAVRVPGLLIGLSVGLALYWNARLAGRSIPWVSFALFGLNAVALRFVDSVRAYGLGILLMLITFNLLWRLALQPTRRRTLLAALFAMISVQTLYQNGFLIAAMCAGAVAVTVR